MNEQEMMAKKQVEKREKTDTILAYILIVVLLGCIFAVLYLKFIRKDNNEVTPNEEMPTNNTISLETISSGFNSSDLVSTYLSEGKTINSTVNGDSIEISYDDGSNNRTYTIPLTNNELLFDVSPDDTVIVDIYKEIAYVICAYSGSENTACRAAANSISSETNGVRFETTDDTNNVYVSIVNSIVSGGTEEEVTNETVYDSETIVGLDNNNYTLNINGATIKDITVNINDDNSITINGTVESEAAVKVIAKLYDEEKNIINEKTIDSVTREFEIVFENIENINSIANYSINVEK